MLGDENRHNRSIRLNVDHGISSSDDWFYDRPEFTFSSPEEETTMSNDFDFLFGDQEKPEAIDRVGEACEDLEEKAAEAMTKAVGVAIALMCEAIDRVGEACEALEEACRSCQPGIEDVSSKTTHVDMGPENIGEVEKRPHPVEISEATASVFENVSLPGLGSGKLAGLCNAFPEVRRIREHVEENRKAGRRDHHAWPKGFGEKLVAEVLRYLDSRS
jgi:hypothetical protein